MKEIQEEIKEEPVVEEEIQEIKPEQEQEPEPEPELESIPQPNEEVILVSNIVPINKKVRQKIFDDSQDIFYRPKIEYKTHRLMMGPAKLVPKPSKRQDINDKNIFDISYEERKVPVIKKKFVTFISNL